ncbi:hypothetical protein [Blastopirellula marina]|uniref:Uncharacterized protein n=1 Tax=Blastopirellula marina DSM 3645 TaxID=314230 RepID=A3ZPR9_9BACT|nr:hypothetical protein [Blastopirellula marina]EAQ81747.1 hypothetical protein DSM3645_29237 [Blastopirellula marina DSM 3645]
MNRKEQQAELIYKLGLLLRPIQDIVDYPDQQTPQTIARAMAKYAADRDSLLTDVRNFMQSEPGHFYLFEWQTFDDSLGSLGLEINRNRNAIDGIRSILDKNRRQALNAIHLIPTEIESEVFEANSPFQAYCKLKTYCETTLSNFTWADPYMGASLFHRYLNDLPDAATVTLVTKDRANQPEYQSYLNISRLYASERGPTKYRLIVESSNHDRWLRCDDQLYHLGGSAKDAGHRSPFTISSLSPTPENFQKLDELINSGTELFGPNTPIHQ